jgi:hypothetical protein
MNAAHSELLQPRGRVHGRQDVSKHPLQQRAFAFGVWQIEMPRYRIPLRLGVYASRRERRSPNTVTNM